MKSITLIISLLISLQLMSQNGKATTTKKTFSRTTTVSIVINADKTTVWSILTNAENFAKWNSTVTSLKGTIKKGEKIELKSSLDPKRTFKLKVKEVTPSKELVWGDAMGKRTYTVSEDNGQTVFNMTEKIGGLMFPLFANKIPEFDTSFEQFANDLKSEAERIYNSKH